MAGRGRPRKNTNDGNNANARPEPSTGVESTLRELLNEVKGIKRSQEFIADRHDDLLNEMKSITRDQKTMKGQLNNVSAKQSKAAEEIEAIKARLNKLEQDKIAQGIVVKGLEESGEAISMLMQLAHALEIDINQENDIIKVQWIQSRNGERKMSILRAELVNELLKKDIIKAAKMKRLSTAQLGLAGRDTPVFIDEITTQHTRNLFLEARKLREYGVKYVWTSKGDVLIRVKDGSSVQRIESIQQIDQIKRDAVNNGGVVRDKRRMSDDIDDSEATQPKKRALTDERQQSKHRNGNPPVQKKASRRAGDAVSAPTVRMDDAANTSAHHAPAHISQPRKHKKTTARAAAHDERRVFPPTPLRRIERDSDDYCDYESA